MKVGKEAKDISREMSDFILSYAPNHLTSSPHTLKSYEVTINMYIEYLQEEQNVTPITLNNACFERKMIESWLLYLKSERKCKPCTCNIRLGALRTFLKYLGSRKPKYRYLYIDAKEIPLMKTPKTKVSGLTRNAVKAIMATPDLTTRTGRRDLVFMIIAYATAARISEILAIKLEHIHLTADKPYITVIGKGQKRRTLYLLPKVVAHVKKYLEEFHGGSAPLQDFLFYSRNGSEKKALSQKAVEKRLKLYAQIAHAKCPDVPLNLHAHQFRHAKASHWLEDGINIVQISTLMGHAQLETTMKYLDISTEDELKALATLEDESDRKISKKWKAQNGSLKSFCKISR